MDPRRSQARARARRLVNETERLIELSRRNLHSVRNSLHYASLLLAVVRLRRRARGE
jgi:hypothetical protein